MSSKRRIFLYCFIAWCIGWFLWAALNVFSLSTGTHPSFKLVDDGLVLIAWMINLIALILQGAFCIWGIKQLRGR